MVLTDTYIATVKIHNICLFLPHAKALHKFHVFIGLCFQRTFEFIKVRCLIVNVVDFLDTVVILFSCESVFRFTN